MITMSTRSPVTEVVCKEAHPKAKIIILFIMKTDEVLQFTMKQQVE